MPLSQRAKLFLSLGITISLFAQAPPDPKYGYEVVAIKKSDPTARGVRIGPGPEGGLRTTNTNLMTLLTFAYDVRDYQILDAPSWAKVDGLDVTFTPDKAESIPRPGEADAKQMETFMDRQRQRVQAILRDRFGLNLRRETRDLPVYALIPAKGGVKLKAPEASPEAGGEAGRHGPSMMMNDKGELTATGANMRMLTNVLSNIVRRPVVDETGFEGPFDMKLQFKPDSFGGGGIGTPPPGEAPVVDVEGASIFTALTEQLGLKLESKKGPVTVYVILKAERPGEN